MNVDQPTIVRHQVPPSLRGVIVGIVGHDDVAPPGGRARIQPASSLLILEISLTSPLHIRPLHAGLDADVAHRTFLAGLSTAPVQTVFFGRHTSIQIYLSPMGAYQLLGIPGTETARIVASADELVPQWAHDWADRMTDFTNWPQRFAAVDRELVRHAGIEFAAAPLVTWAWNELQLSGGQVRVGELAQRSGWSVRHLGQLFKAVTGVSLKEVARLIRFEHIHAELGAWQLSDVAQRHGLSDQSHLCREVLQFSGETPLSLSTSRRPTAFTALGVQPGDFGYALRNHR